MTHALIEAVEKSHLKSDLPTIAVGDTVDVHLRIVEGAKERIQVFGGVVIAMKGSGATRMITVRRIVANEGVERTIPIHSPRVAKIDVKRHGDVRRAKLFYLRERIGKSRRLRDRRRGLESLVTEPAATATDAAATGAPATAPASGGEAKPAK
jgi:large subunit ribosomal protein L19